LATRNCRRHGSGAFWVSAAGCTRVRYRGLQARALELALAYNAKLPVRIGHGRPQARPRLCSVAEHRLAHALPDAQTSSIADQPLHQTKTKLLPSRSITASARTSRFQRFRRRATCAQTNSRAPSIVLNQFDDLWSPSAFRRARDRRSSCRILACHLIVHAKLHLSCGAHPR
jgi:hypothetical protein